MSGAGTTSVSPSYSNSPYPPQFSPYPPQNLPYVPYLQPSYGNPPFLSTGAEAISYPHPSPFSSSSISSSSSSYSTNPNASKSSVFRGARLRAGKTIRVKISTYGHQIKLFYLTYTSYGLPSLFDVVDAFFTKYKDLDIEETKNGKDDGKKKEKEKGKEREREKNRDNDGDSDDDDYEEGRGGDEDSRDEDVENEENVVIPTESIRGEFDNLIVALAQNVDSGTGCFRDEDMNPYVMYVIIGCFWTINLFKRDFSRSLSEQQLHGLLKAIMKIIQNAPMRTRTKYMFDRLVIMGFNKDDCIGSEQDKKEMFEFLMKCCNYVKCSLKNYYWERVSEFVDNCVCFFLCGENKEQYYEPLLEIFNDLFDSRIDTTGMEALTIRKLQKNVLFMRNSLGFTNLNTRNIDRILSENTGETAGQNRATMALSSSLPSSSSSSSSYYGGGGM
ncbi:hypothetical protein FACS1894152_2540 [Bacilli bacterium]|nr:hypothetical protein FACS1894152_2540 [Bacilli bacterium]